MPTPRKPQTRQRSEVGGTRIYAPTHSMRAAAPAKKDKPGEKRKMPEKRETARRGQAAAPARRTQEKAAGRAAPAKRPGPAGAPPTKRPAQAAAKKKRAPQGRGWQETVVVPAALLGLHAQQAQAAGYADGAQASHGDEKRGGRRKWFSGSDRARRRREKRADARNTLFYAEYPAEKKKRERRPVSKRALLTILLSTLSAVVLMLCGWFFFLLDEVVISGNETYAPALITELSGLVNGRHMLLCDIEAARENIENVPYIKVLSIERVFPRAIHISVLERKETAVILSQGYEVVIDMEGHVLSIGAAGAANELVRVSGMSQHGYQVNKPMGAGDDMQAAILRDILKNLNELDLLSEVAEIDLSNPLRVSMRTRLGVNVLLGQADDLADKLMWMRDALPSLSVSNISAGTLDVSAKAGPVFSPAEAHRLNPASGQPEDGAAPEDQDGAAPENQGGTEPEAPPEE